MGAPLIGARVPRKEDYRFLTGAGQYTDDVTLPRQTFAAFVRGVQEVHDLQLGELWGARGALMLALLERTVEAATDEDEVQLPCVIVSVRRIGDANWMQLFTSSNVVDQVLAADPTGTYTAMDDSSRDAYRHVVSYLARHSPVSERDVAEAAVCLADDVADSPVRTGVTAAHRRMHVGYYLVDEGLPVLKSLVGFRAPLWHRLADAVMRRPAAFYLGGVAVVTIAIIVAMLEGIEVPASAWVALLLLLPAMQAAVELVIALVPAVSRPRALPKLDFSRGIRADCERSLVKRMSPVRVQTPPVVWLASANLVTGPPAVATLRSWLSAKKPIQAPSGEKNGRNAPSVPASGVTSNRSSGRT